MIAITRLDGSTLVVNADLIETLEHHGDTVVTLVSGNRFVVREDVTELTEAVLRFRAGVLAAAESLSMPTAVDYDAVQRAALAAEAGKVIPMASSRRSGETE